MAKALTWKGERFVDFFLLSNVPYLGGVESLIVDAVEPVEGVLDAVLLGGLGALPRGVVAPQLGGDVGLGEEAVHGADLGVAQGGEQAEGVQLAGVQAELGLREKRIKKAWRPRR